MRLSAGHWGNPYHNLEYTEDVETRRRPNFLPGLPPTLKPKRSLAKKPKPPKRSLAKKPKAPKTHACWDEETTKILIDAYEGDDGSYGLIKRLAKVVGLGGFSELQIKNKVSRLISEHRLAKKPRKPNTCSWDKETTDILIEAYKRDNGSYGLIKRLAKVAGLGGFSEQQLQNKVSRLISERRLAKKPKEASTKILIDGHPLIVQHW